MCRQPHEPGAGPVSARGGNRARSDTGSDAGSDAAGGGGRSDNRAQSDVRSDAGGDAAGGGGRSGNRARSDAGGRGDTVGGSGIARCDANGGRGVLGREDGALSLMAGDEVLGLHVETVRPPEGLSGRKSRGMGGRG